jgi:hypothetical protein
MDIEDFDWIHQQDVLTFFFQISIVVNNSDIAVVYHCWALWSLWE